MTAAISVAGLAKSYGRVEALRGLDLEVPPGKITGFLGPNGAGKTTTFRAVLGLTRPSAGEVEVLGHPVPDELEEVVCQVGAIVEEPGLIRPLTGRVNLEVAADTLGFGHDRIEEMLAFVGLTEEAGRRVEGYSKGMRQRLALAAALLGDPKLLILDEPLDGLDPAGQHAFKARLRELVDEGRTVVVSSHDLSDVEQLADHVAVIDEGKLVVQGDLESLLEGSSVLVTVDDAGSAAAILQGAGMEAAAGEGSVRVAGGDGSDIIRALAAHGVFPAEVRLERGSLEDLFLGITGAGS